MNLYKLTYDNGHAILIDVLNLGHAIMVTKSEAARAQQHVEFVEWDDVRGDYLTTTYLDAPQPGRSRAGMEKVMWYELPLNRQMKVSNGSITLTKYRIPTMG